MDSGALLHGRWRELQKQWGDEIAIKFAGEFLQQVLDNCQDLDDLRRQLEIEVSNKPGYASHSVSRLF